MLLGYHEQNASLFYQQVTKNTYLSDKQGPSGGAEVCTVNCLDRSLIWPSPSRASNLTKWVVPGRHLLITQFVSLLESLTSLSWKKMLNTSEQDFRYIITDT